MISWAKKGLIKKKINFCVHIVLKDMFRVNLVEISSVVLKIELATNVFIRFLKTTFLAEDLKLISKEIKN